MKNTKLKRLAAGVLSLAVTAACLPQFALPLSAETDTITVVSLGDSYSSGEGIEPFYNQSLSAAEKVQNYDWLAHRSELSWPGQLRFGGDSKPVSKYKGVNWFFVASSGAGTFHLTNPQTKSYNYPKGKAGETELPPQLDVFDNLPKNSVDYVTVSIGGNDVGFVDLMKTAITNTDSALQKSVDKIWNEFYAEKGTRSKIKAAYHQIAEAAGPQATILIAGYPTLLSADGGKVKALGFTVKEISKNQAKIVNQAVVKFNEALALLADECQSEGINTHFVDVAPAFAGHEAFSSDPYINDVYVYNPQPEDLDQSADVSSYSMHPNAKGAEIYAGEVQNYIDDLPWTQLTKDLTLSPQIYNSTSPRTVAEDISLKSTYKTISPKKSAYLDLSSNTLDGSKMQTALFDIGDSLDGDFTLHGGQIIGNENSAALEVNGGTLVLDSMTLSGAKNTVTADGGTLRLSGNTVISDSVNADVMLKNGAVIEFDSSFSADALISVASGTAPAAEAPVVLTNGLDGGDAADYLVSADPSYLIGINRSGEAILGVPAEISFSGGFSGFEKDPETVAAGSMYTLPAFDGTKPAGMIFEGWDVDGELYPAGEAVEITGDTTLSPAMKAVPSVQSAGMTLGSALNLEFYVSVPPSANTGSFVLDGPSGELTTAVSDCTKTVDVYKVSYPMTAIQANQPVTLKLVDGSGNALALYRSDGSQIEGNAFTYSVADYVRNASETVSAAEMKKIRAMYTYISYAARWKYGTALPDDGFVDALPDVSAEDLAAYRLTKSGDASGFTDMTAALMLESETAFKLYFNSPAKPEATLDGAALDPVKFGERYYVEIPRIGVLDLDTFYTVMLGGKYKVVFSAFSYAYAVLAQKSENSAAVSPELADLMQALYAYNRAFES